ncbi:caspase domain-containing protein [Streptomyces lydicus]|uniref:caspase domain-containing protein n=1 Tax=Streptomyces lydicus TaxID=47763 RepID=UPI0037BE01AF
MSHGRFALLIATGTYDDPGLRRLRSPVRDAEGLAEVLGDPRIGGFSVTTVVDARHYEINRAIQKFFRNRKPNDVLLLHLSCHGIKDEQHGELFFAARDTEQDLLDSTSVSAKDLRNYVDDCRSRSIVLLLDCCFSGAFLPGMKSSDTTAHVWDALAGYGHAVLTATNRMEYAWEGNHLSELEPEPSHFTGAVIEGLRTGQADRNGDGLVSVQELHEYVCEVFAATRVRQTPLLWARQEKQGLTVAHVPRESFHPGHAVLPVSPQVVAPSLPAHASAAVVPLGLVVPGSSFREKPSPAVGQAQGQALTPEKVSAVRSRLQRMGHVVGVTLVWDQQSRAARQAREAHWLRPQTDLIGIWRWPYLRRSKRRDGLVLSDLGMGLLDGDIRVLVPWIDLRSHQFTATYEEVPTEEATTRPEYDLRITGPLLNWISPGANGYMGAFAEALTDIAASVRY